jgi:uncharacterized integral membrane protein
MALSLCNAIVPHPASKSESRAGGIASVPGEAHVGAMARRSPLDDPQKAAHAWARYRRLMRGMFLFTVAVVILALAAIYNQTGMVSVHFFIATALGIGLAMLLMAALMGLVFLSSGTGHDESVSDHSNEDDEDKN